MQDHDASPPERPPAGLPDDAVAMTVGEVWGWLYRIHDPYGRHLQFFVWPDAEVYRVTLVDPPLERGHDIDDLGLTQEGRVRLQQDPRTVLDAFKISIAWAASLAVAARTSLRNTDFPSRPEPHPRRACS